MLDGCRFPLIGPGDLGVETTIRLSKRIVLLLMRIIGIQRLVRLVLLLVPLMLAAFEGFLLFF